MLDSKAQGIRDDKTLCCGREIADRLNSMWDDMLKDLQRARTQGTVEEVAAEYLSLAKRYVRAGVHGWFAYNRPLGSDRKERLEAEQRITNS